LTAVTSGSIVFSPGAANKLAWGVEPPSSVTIDKTISPAMTVLIEDQYGNLVNSNASISLSQHLNGTETVNNGTVSASGGIATFNSVTITGNKTGSDSFTATSNSLTSSDSTSFTVN